MFEYTSKGNFYDTRKIWVSDDGDLYNPVAPAAIYYLDGKVVREEWSVALEAKGNFYREDDKPAVIEYREDGSVKRHEWYESLDNIENMVRALDHDVDYELMPTRINGPSVVEYHKNGFPSREEWTNENGILDRYSGPAVIDFHENGVPRREEWFNDGDHYRYGPHPNVVEYSPDGEITLEMWLDPWGEVVNWNGRP